MARAGEGELATLKEEGSRETPHSRELTRHRICKAAHPLLEVKAGVLDFAPALKEALKDFSVRVPFEHLNKGLEIVEGFQARQMIKFVKSKG